MIYSRTVLWQLHVNSRCMVQHACKLCCCCQQIFCRDAYQLNRVFNAHVLQGALAQPPRQRYRPRLTAANFRYFLRGRNAKAAAGDHVVAARKRAHLKPYDRFLRKFHYQDALDAALATRRADVVDSVLEELAARGGLQSAIAGRNAEQVLPLLRHVCKYIADPRHTRLLAGVAHRLLDAYAPVVHVHPQVSTSSSSSSQR